MAAMKRFSGNFNKESKKSEKMLPYLNEDSDTSSSDSSASDNEYETAGEDSRHERTSTGNRVNINAINSRRSSSVKKDKKSVVQNNIRIGSLVGNLHIGPSFTAVSSMPPPQPSRPKPQTRAERHIEQCLHSERIIDDEEIEIIADAIGRRWKDVGLKLRINLEHLDYLERDHVRKKNAPFRMLYYWVQHKDQKATVKKLTNALLYAGEVDAIKKIPS